MTLRDYLRIIRASWLVITLVALTTVAASAAYTFLVTPQYESTARLFVSTSQADTSEAFTGAQFSAQRVTSYADLVRSRELAADVVDDLGLDAAPGDLVAAVSASVVPDTVNLEIRIVDEDPNEAQRLAQGYAEGMVDLVRELETPVGSTAAPIKATIVDPASFSSAPISPQPARNLALGLILGLLLGVAVAVLRDLLDTTVKSTEDIAAATSAPIVGAIGYDTTVKSDPLITSLAPHAPRVEAFRVMRTNLQFLDVDKSSKVIVGTSAVPGEGKTTTMVNLALALAQGGQRVLLVECDLRRPKAAQSLGLDSSIGVTTILLGRATVADAVQKHAGSGLRVLGSGAVPPNPAELIQSHAMGELLAEVRRDYDVVLIDAPPLLPVTDAALLAAQADGALLIVRHGKTTHDQLAGAVNRLAQVDATPLGVVFNMTPKTGGSHGYGYGYGYGYSPEEPARPAARTRGGKRARA
ncbi:polysaccharide biosynthesis tyrosine autokinase [Nocardioides sp. CPCC 205120]|uniref:polysaccharide biosynthesis tyrosine autokinase n=1 Tax=Nocardioides sp. CPCC 205120 TaxID=3406462 RepID=UPI003B50454B